MAQLAPGLLPQHGRQLVLATTNPGKLAELRALLAGAPYVLVDPGDLGVSLEVPETGTTFAENARLKARAWAQATGRLALADDSGLEVDALDRAPGIHSARWPQPEVTYPDRFRLLQELLQHLPPARRSARYRCVIAVADANRVLIEAEGMLEGRIAEAPRGTGGFGYDPIFELPEQGRTVAELSDAEKQQISHRARAAAGALAGLQRLAAAHREGEAPPPPK
jgi:XTP/dITP diphosphohydrolase